MDIVGNVFEVMSHEWEYLGDEISASLFAKRQLLFNQNSIVKESITKGANQKPFLLLEEFERNLGHLL